MFQDDIEDEEEPDEAEMFPSSIPRPEPELKPMSLDDLMKSDERNDAILFLLSLDEIMEGIAQQYKAVRENYHRNIEADYPQSNIVEMLIEAAVSTNMGIQQVQRLDMELSIQYPHLTTPFRLLSTVVLPDFIREVASILREHASESFTEKDATVFLGDCLECTFCNDSDPCNRTEFIVPELCTEFKVNSHGEEQLRQLVKKLQMLTIFEVPMLEDKRRNKDMLDSLMRQMPSRKSHSWLANVPHISVG